jgi:hypothetical protein
MDSRLKAICGQHTDAMKRPNAPPKANPIVPDKTVFAGHDSMIICIYFKLVTGSKEPTGGVSQQHLG